MNKFYFLLIVNLILLSEFASGQSNWSWDTNTSAGLQPANGIWGVNSFWTLKGSGGTTLNAWPGTNNDAYFEGADGTYAITVNGTQNVDSIIFNNNGYTLSGGTLSLNNGIIEVAPTKSAFINSVISGTAGLTKNSSGTLTLGGTNTYSGNTVVNAGTLNVTGTTTSSITVNNSATLAGNGTVGTVVVNAGGGIAPGNNSTGTLTANGSVVLNSTSILTFELGAIGSSDKILISGSMNLDGIINATSVAGFGAGTYNLMTTGGVIADFGLTLGTMPSGYSYTIQVTASAVNLVVIAVGTNWTWDTSPAPGIQPGNGTWGIDSYWTPRGGPGTVLYAWPGAGNNAWFEGADGAYAIAVNGTQSVDSITFNNSGYDLSGGNISKGPGIIEVAATKTASISSIISGSSLITKTGGGEITLSGGNTFSGGYMHTNGDIILNNNSALGSGTATMNGTGRMILSAGTIIPNALTINAGTPGVGQGCVHMNTAGSATWSGPISINASTSNGGHFASRNTGILYVTGTITAGPSVIVGDRIGTIYHSGSGSCSLINQNEGTVLINTNNGIPTNTSYRQSSGTPSTGTLDLNGFNQTLSDIESNTIGTYSITNSQGIPSVLTLSGIQALNKTYFGSIQGNLSIIKNGTFIETLTGASTYSGSTTINNGAIHLLGSLSGSNITVNSGGTLSGNGNAAAGAVVNSGGIIEPGDNSTGTLSSGNLVLNSAAILNYELGAIASSDKIVVTGNLTLDGSINLTSLAGFGVGTYTILTYSGALTNNGLTVGTVIPGYNCSVQISGTNINLVVTVTTDWTWDLNTAVGLQPGNGTWGTDSYWTPRNGPGTSLTNWPGAGNNAYFEGANGTYAVTLNGTQNADSITFNNTGYTLSGGTIALTGTNPAITTNTDATINTLIMSTGNVQKEGSGNLILNYTGGFNHTLDKLYLNSGTTSLLSGDFSVTGSDVNGKSITVNSALNMSGGSLAATSRLVYGFATTSPNVAISGGNTSGTDCIIGWNANPTVIISGGTHTFSNAIYHRDAGSGSLRISGGTVSSPLLRSQLASVNDQFDIYLDAGGTLQTGRIVMQLNGSAVTSGNHNMSFNFNGGTLVATSAANALLDTFQVAATSTRSFNVTINSGGAIINTNGLNTYITNSLKHLASLGATPDGGLIKTGLGNLQLRVSNSYTGPTEIVQGTLVLGNANIISDVSQCRLNGGVLLAPFNEQLNTLTLLENSSIYLSTGNHTLSFSPSNGTTWTSGKTLIIYDWLGGYNGTAANGSNPKIFMGSSADLSAAKLAQINFFRTSDGLYYPAMQLASGEIVPCLPKRGNLASPATVCSGTNSGTITLSNFDGTITRWESSLDNFATAGTPIANTTSSLPYTNLTATTYYRAVTQYNTWAPLYSDTLIITVIPATVGGSVNTAAVVCSGTNGGILTLSGHTGNISEWQSSLDNFSTAGTPIANITTSQSYANLTATTSYRAVLQSGTCAVVNSSPVTITVNALPSPPTGIPGSNCGNGTVALSASGSPSGYKWYDASTGGTLLASTANYTTPSISVNTNYYVSTVDGNSCESSTRTAVTASIVSIPNNSQIPGAGLITLYYFNGNANDISGNGNNGTLQNGPIQSTDRFGNANAAYTLNGTSQYITTTTQYTNPTIFTIGIWFKTNTVQGGNLMNFATFQNATFGGSHDRHLYMANDGKILFGVYPGAVQTIATTGSYNDNQWHFAAASLSASGMKLYVDGFLEASNATITTAENYNGYWRVGEYDLNGWTSTPSSAYFGGSIDNAYIYNRELTAGEIYILYNNPFSAGYNNPICQLGGTLNLSANTFTGATYSWTGPNSFTSSSQNPSIPSITASELGVYTLTITVSGCSASSKVLVRIYPPSVGGNVTSDNTVCSGTNSGSLSLSGQTGKVIGWESSLDNFATAGTNIANTSISQNYTNLANTTSYRSIVQNSGCPIANSSFATITVDPVSVGGSISGAATVCSGTNSGSLLLSGHTGNVIGWESSLDNFATAGTPIINTTATQSYTNITSTTSYRAIVKSGTCANVTSTPVTISVTPLSIGGTTSSAATVCSGSNAGTLNLTGETGSILYWESSLDNFATAGTSIANTTASQSYSNITATTSYRAVVQNGTCPAINSSPVTITVTPVSVGGSVSSAATVCSGSNGAVLTLSGHIGTVNGWEFSLDNFATAGTPIANTTASQSYSNITATTSYRAIVQNGICAAINSSPVTITVTPLSVGGTISSAATVCSGSNGATLTLSGNTGTVNGWEFSLDNFATAGTPIANTTVSQSYSNITATTSYRAIVQNGTCAAVNSSTVTINVTSVSLGGSVSSAATVCSGSNSGTLTLSGNIGTINGWESSLDNFATAGTPIANTTTSYTYTNITATTSFRAIVQNGTCTSVNSSSATITVTPLSVGGTVSSATTVCTGSNSGTLTLSGNIGTINGWESSLDNFATAGTPIVNTTATQTYSNITSTTSYRAIVQNGICSAINSSPVTITITPLSIGGTISSAATVCSGSNGATLALSGNLGNISGWESSLDNFATAGTSIANTTASQSYSNITATTSYRAVVQNGTCPAINSSPVTITVTPVSVGGSVSSATTVCSGSNGAVLTLSGHIGTVNGWESSLDNFATAGTPIANTTASQSYSNITATTSYRAIVQNGICAATNSSPVIITVTPISFGGSVSADAIVCSGSNGATLTLSGNIGTILNWESSLDNFTTAGTPISNTTTVYSYNNLTSTTSYRAIIQNGTCPSSTSTTATITVNQLPALPIGTTASVCSSGAVSLSASGAVNYNWYANSTGGVPLASGMNFTTPILSATTTYYVSAIDASLCESALRTSVDAIVSLPAIGGTLSSPDTVLSGNNLGTLNLSGYSGTIVTWESSNDNFTTPGTILNNSTSTLTYQNLTQTTYYRVLISSAPCATNYSDTLMIEVIPDTNKINPEKLIVAPGLSPNDDGVNDNFIIINNTGNQLNLVVFNRWGNLVYESSDYQNNWNGKSNHGSISENQQLPEGTYFYVIEVENKKYSGYLTLKY